MLVVASLPSSQFGKIVDVFINGLNLFKLNAMELTGDLF